MNGQDARIYVFGEPEATPVNKMISVDKAKRTRRKIESPIARNLGKLLGEHRLSQREAAKIAGVSPSVLNQWLCGAVPRDLRSLLKLVMHLGGDFQQVLTGVSSQKLHEHHDVLVDFEVDGSQQLSGVFLLTAHRLRRKGPSNRT